MNLDLSLKQIGVVHTPYKSQEAVRARADVSPPPCRVEIFKEFEAGLLHIEEFSHLYLFAWLHLERAPALLVQPPQELAPQGVFATRSQKHPNSLALSLVELMGRQGRFLDIATCDFVDQTPLIDIKPFWPQEVDGQCRFASYERERKRLELVS